ncbi:hypothetical protein [Limnoglobus roseus]|uniref:Secreted protein n=1 Tax=Limnoglobus roseus TaxID=2598579 RepID=A0A5C1AAQ0_9BACT|nr:hypothetical protein [Limnoglobus roseus]QEL15253.1 hypothetical protein PX52LOC_02168 [Limnoglobus roseus]
MRQIKRLFLVLVLATSMLGCGKSSGGKVEIKDASPEQIAEQEANQKSVTNAEADRQKNLPKEKTQQQSVDDAERSRRR